MASIEVRSRCQIGAVNFVACSLGDAVSFLLQDVPWRSLSDKEKAELGAHFANAYTLALADTDSRYRELLNEATLVFMDGKPVVWAAKILYRRRAGACERIYGPDLMRGVLAASGTFQRHFLLGSTPAILRRLEAALARDYPNARVVGSYSPPFNDVTDSEELDIRDELISAARPTHIWVGLGTPKQDFEVARLARKHEAFVFGVGAAFDFLSGSTAEAPKIIQTLGLQWAHRLIHDPRRLAKRYLWGNPRFIWAVMRNIRATTAN